MKRIRNFYVTCSPLETFLVFTLTLVNVRLLGVDPCQRDIVEDDALMEDYFKRIFLLNLIKKMWGESFLFSRFIRLTFF